MPALHPLQLLCLSPSSTTHELSLTSQIDYCFLLLPLCCIQENTVLITIYYNSRGLWYMHMNIYWVFAFRVKGEARSRKVFHKNTGKYSPAPYYSPKLAAIIKVDDTHSWCINSSPPSAAYMCQRISSALVQIMACRLLSQTIISTTSGLLSIGPLEINFSEMLIKIHNIHENTSENYICEMAVILSRRMCVLNQLFSNHCVLFSLPISQHRLK